MNDPLANSLVSFGLLFLGLGFMHRLSTVEAWDTRIYKSIHTNLQRYSGFFRYIWPLGTTPVTVLLLAITFIPGWQIGLRLSLTYIGIAIIERIIKSRLQRERPFHQVPETKLHQPNPPKDPSHPSGDAMRVWYMAIVFPFALNLPWPVTLTACFVAAILSLGRIALGVHYPLDVAGGTGLGLFAAGFTIISSQLSVFN